MTAAASPLPGLPGAVPDPGTGVVVEALLDGLLAEPVPDPGPVPAGDGAADDAAVPIGRARTDELLEAHRRHRASWYGELLGPLRVPAGAVDAVVAGLRPGDHALRMTLVVPPGDPDPVTALRAARGLLMDDDRAEVTGVELGLPPLPDLAEAARAGLAELDVSVPGWFVVPPDDRARAALEVLAEDGAENVALHLPAGVDHAAAAAVLRAVVDLDLAVAVSPADLQVVTGPDGIGLLNLLGAVRAALNGAETEQVAGILAAGRVEPLAAAARRMSDADAAVVRAFLPAVTCTYVGDVVADLEGLGLIAPDAA